MSLPTIKKTIIMIDGGYLRKIVQKNANQKYNPDYIEKCALDLQSKEIDLIRVLYYDCPLFEGNTKLPISGKKQKFSNQSRWLNSLAIKNLFAVREGILKFRGYIPKSIPLKSKPLNDNDFSPCFEQKGVDMRIGLDIAQYSHNKTIDKIILISNDTDCVPALKYARKNGIFVSIVQYISEKIAPELLYHVDEIIKKKFP
jgi:uncharacterized LabA/DUF88 family protein